MSEWTKERLREIVGGAWPEAIYGWDTDTAVELSCEDRETSVYVASPSRQETCGMLAAAVLAPELLALVEAARGAQSLLGHLMQFVEDDSPEEAELDERWRALNTALARLPEEVTCLSSD